LYVIQGLLKDPLNFTNAHIVSARSQN